MKKKLYLLLTFLLLSSCASEDEVKERQENAFDLSGNYEVAGSSNEVEMNYAIYNKSGRNVIYAVLLSRSKFNSAEKAILKSYSLDEAKVYSHFFDNPLDLKNSSWIDRHHAGGNNISDDFGETSKFSICSDKMSYDQLTTIGYCLSGIAEKKSNTIKGNLMLRVERKKETTQPDGQVITSIEPQETQLNFSIIRDSLFYKQYLGSWSADYVWSNQAEMNNIVKKISFYEETSNENIKIITTSLDNLSNLPSNSQFITFRKNRYYYNKVENQITLTNLLASNPASIGFTLSANTQAGIAKLKFIGQIWSLGNYTGEIIHIDPAGAIETVAIVRMKKI